MSLEDPHMNSLSNGHPYLKTFSRPQRGERVILLVRLRAVPLSSDRGYSLQLLRRPMPSPPHHGPHMDLRRSTPLFQQSKRSTMQQRYGRKWVEQTASSG